jgi:hypothetical protein
VLSGRGRPQDQQGFVLIAALVLIALLFFIETALAVAVSSALHSLNVIGNQAAIRYAAESAAARGIGAMTAVPSGPCPSNGSINGLIFSTTCFSVPGIQAPAASAVEQRAFPASAVGSGSCIGARVFQENEVSAVVWTVLAWRGPNGGGTVSVWMDDQKNCAGPAGKQLCPQAFAGTGQPHLFICAPSGQGVSTGDWLHVTSTGAATLGPFVVRSAGPGSGDTAVIAVGQADTELDEAEVLLSGGTGGSPPIQDLWDTLLQ